MNIYQLRQWLADGKTDRVLDGLLEAKPPIDPDLHEEATLLSARYEILARQKRAGTLKFQDENTERAQINAALLEILNHLKEHHKPGFFANPLAKWGTILVATIVVLGGVAKFSGLLQGNDLGQKTELVNVAQPPANNKPDSLPAAQSAPVSQSVSARPESRSNPAATKPSPTAPTSSLADTTLTIACKSNKGRLNLHFKNNETMRFYFKVSQACTVRSIYKLADGRLVLLDNDRAVSAAQVGTWLEIGAGFDVSEPFGEEQVYVFAQNTAFDPLVTVVDGDGYYFIQEGLPDALRKTRGFKKKKRFAEDSVMLATSL
ncbi:MAG: hypothetical protein ACKVU0_07960 [Saprospiraceae bacterium]